MGKYAILNNSITNAISILLGIVFFLFLCTSFISIKQWIKRHRNNLYPALREKLWSIFFIILISTISIILFILFVSIFNNNNPFWIENRKLTTEWEEWGGFATCFATLFTLITVFWMYKAFQIQANTADRSSFDAAFMQIFAQHDILYKKVNCSGQEHCHFAEFRTFFKYITQKTSSYDISCIWEIYNRFMEISYGEKYPSNFRNYFKYIHREITFIQNNFKDSWGRESRKSYVRLIEGQMNNDELFCYFVNQLEYCARHWDKKKIELINYLTFLQDNDFFKEICEEKSSGYSKDVKNVLNLFQNQNQNINIQKYIIKQEWFK